MITQKKNFVYFLTIVASALILPGVRFGEDVRRGEEVSTTRVEADEEPEQARQHRLDG